MRPGTRDERAHGVLRDAIARGYIASGEVYVLPLLPGHDLANEARLSVNRGARHLGAGVAAWVTDAAGVNCWRECADALAPHGVRFRLFAKTAARRYVNGVAQGDPANLRYNPYARHARPIVDENGNPMPVARA